MVTITPLVIALFASVVAAAPSIDSRALEIERAIANAPPPVEDRSLASLFYPNKYTDGPAPQIASDVVNTWTQLAHYQAAVYCGPDKVKAWNCGVHCVGKPKIVLTGGDHDATPWYYVANNGSHVFIAISGTNTKSAKSIATDLNFFHKKPDAAYFPGAGKSEVHTGFYEAFTRMAAPIASAVHGEVQAGTTQVIVMGHSLGAGVGELLGTYLARLLGSSATVSTRLFASPRVGNVPWSEYVDSTFPGGKFQYMVNYNDPVPHLPPKDLGFRHPSNELYITAVGSSDLLACSGSENKKCSDQFADPGNFITSLRDWATSDVHNGPYAGVMMGGGGCS